MFRGLALEDELEVTTDERAAGRPVRVGYLVVAPGPPAAFGTLAVPQLLDDERVRQQQEDLAYVLVLAILVGVVAAVVLAGLAAGTLARPVAALRDAAVAVGRGVSVPAFPPGAPLEFTPVLSAFERMASDVRRSQGALEEARRRTAQVLANVATGVVAVDSDLRVTMANPRAEELLGTALEPGDLLRRTAAPVWEPVWDAVAAFLAAGAAGIAEREFEVAGRQIRVQLAALGPSPDGCVVALDDATQLARAARVIAWGEMARQVAHEIKNPLTPIRLGIQHLQRARGGAADFDRTLQETAASTSPGPEVPFEDVVKGFEVDPGRFVMVGRDELEAIEPERSHTVEIEHFVLLAEIDPIYFDRSYYVAPQRGAERPYALLLEAMRRAGRVAIARFVLRTKQHLAAIRALDDVIVLETLFHADEIRELKEVDGIPTGVTADDRELDLADKLIGILETSWDPSSYRDEYRQRVLDLIEARAQSEGSIAVAEGAPEAPSRLPELLAALRASVEQAQEQTKAEPDHKQSSGRRSRRRTG